MTKIKGERARDSIGILKAWQRSGPMSVGRVEEFRTEHFDKYCCILMTWPWVVFHRDEPDNLKGQFTHKHNIMKQ